MKIGIIGLPQTGKRTLFSILAEGKKSEENVQKGGKPEAGIGMSRVYDERLDKLAELYKPKKVVPEVITYLLVPKLSKSSEDNREAFKSIAQADALCHVVRNFSDECVFHIDGNVDAVRDIEYVESELILNDLVFAESRIEKIEKDIKRKNEPILKKELELTHRMIEVLNNEKPLRTFEFNDEEKKLINAYPYLSRKNMFIALNVDETSLSSDSVIKDLEERFKESQMHFVQMSAKIELELRDIDDPEERKMFLDDLGISSSALEKITQLSYRALNRISFFTVGEDECRAWMIRDGSCAPVAGGAVHSDIERGFIRAEHMLVEDLLTLGSEAKVKEAGKFSLKGKDYIVHDGDILHFRFNV